MVTHNELIDDAMKALIAIYPKAIEPYSNLSEGKELLEKIGD
jgi:hypothetical protein